MHFMRSRRGATLEELRGFLAPDPADVVDMSAYWARVREVATELGRLGYAEIPPLPRSNRDFEPRRNGQRPADRRVVLTPEGDALAASVPVDIGRAFDTILKAMYAAHPQLRRYLAAVAGGRYILIPTITSAERHISDTYASARTLAAAVAQGTFDTAALLATTERRLGRPLALVEREEITAAVAELVKRHAAAARTEAQPKFSRAFTQALTEKVVPATLRAQGLGLGFTQLRNLLRVAEEFQVACATSDHPRHDVWLAFGTAEIETEAEGDRITGLRFDRGLAAMRPGFLERLYAIYQQMQEWGCGTVVEAWGLRAAFCFTNRCAPGVFDQLFIEHHAGSDAFAIVKDYKPRKRRGERGIRLDGREIDLVQMARRA